MRRSIDPLASEECPRFAFPIWLKLGYTAFVVLLVAVYWPAYGPLNFLWFCDVAAIVTCVALWLESPLLAGSQAVAMTVSQTVWIIDFLSGGRLLGFAAYMFDPGIKLYVRALSSFHIWLPFLLLWMVWKVGYHRRSFWFQTVLCGLVLAASFLLTDPRHPRRGYPYEAVNINRVYGPKLIEVQHWMPSVAYLLLQIVFYPVVVYLPAHLVLRKWLAQPIRKVEAACA